MSDSKHTPERVSAAGIELRESISDIKDGKTIAKFHDQTQAEYAAECWNACAPLGEDPAASMAVARKRFARTLEAQHDLAGHYGDGVDVAHCPFAICVEARVALEGIGGVAT